MQNFEGEEKSVLKIKTYYFDTEKNRSTNTFNVLNQINQYSILLLTTLLCGLYGVFIEKSKLGADSEPYNPGSVFIVSEVTKLSLSFLFLVQEKGWKDMVSTLIKTSTCEWLMFCVPASIYCITNNLDMIILRYIDPTTTIILYQFKIVTTAILHWIVFRKNLKIYQKYGILFLMVGSVVVTIKNDATLQVNRMGLFLITLQTFLSPMAGIYTEWVYKNGTGKNKSIHQQNISMYLWGILFNFVRGTFTKDSALSISLKGFNIWTWLVVVCYAGSGLGISFIIYV